MDKVKVLDLLEKIQKVLPYIITQEIACNGLKCRELVCSSCCVNFRDDVEKSIIAYNDLLRAYKDVKKELDSNTLGT